MEISLDALHYMIGETVFFIIIFFIFILLFHLIKEHGYLRGCKEKTHNIIIQVVEIVSRCSDELDDVVQLQV
jgi:hypothetical protein